MRYSKPTTDSNRARWPLHGLWRQFEDVIGIDLTENCAGVLPCDVVKANRLAKMRELDAQLLGLFVTRVAISGVSAEEFPEFMANHVEALERLAADHPQPIAERIAKAGAKYQLN
ncbi:hypothetical protein J7399_18350 [Shimia sp. R9_1]|uniref:hypothetical protein n=1 Tax=Shimia sp. R9_1 TaxID=2821111 RepID=UPI001ADA7BA6|nr:hypothetical protein [Shimia sp. R9_1]MBO9409404.1 hypothetical protein [Shimia sp. R9_1]